MYHPAAALRTPALERESFEDVARVPDLLLRAREQHDAARAASPDRTGEPARAATPPRPEDLPTAPTAGGPAPAPPPTPATPVPADPVPDDAQLTLF